MPMSIHAFARCRNERLRLPAFLDHYRRLGVTRFFIADNASTDGSSEYLSAQSDVEVLRHTGSYRRADSGTDWVNSMLARFGVGSWCVTVDIDELLCYPGSENAPLPVLTEYLDRHHYEALGCLLLDMYPAGPVRDSRYEAGGDLLAAAPYFDADPYARSPFHLCPGVMIRGGMRERVFYPEFRSRGLAAWILRTLRRQKPPCLTKVPLVRWDRRSTYLHSNHFMSMRAVAPETGALLHFKFLQDFHERVCREAERGEYYKRATEYRRYAETLRRDPSAALASDASVRFEGTDQLVQLGLMQDSQDWAACRAAGTPSRRP